MQQRTPGQGDDELARQTTLTGHEVYPTALRLYRLRWLIDDIALVVGAFRSPHTQTADMAHAWQGLMRSFASTDPW